MRRWVGALLAGLVVFFLLPPAPASAHAALVSATPTQGAVIGSSPTEVRLTFNEPVGIIPGRTQVIAPNGKRVNDGDPVVSGTTLRIAVRTADRPLGTYLVSYRIISADGHPLSGGFMFSVGAPSQTAPEVADGDSSVTALLAAAKYAGYAGLTLVVAPLLMLALLWPRRLSRRGPLGMVWVGLGLIAASTLASLWLQVPYLSGAGPLDVSGVELGQVLTSTVGLTLVARLALVGLTAFLVRRAHGWPLVVVGVAGMVTWPLSGHPTASPQPVVSVVADTLHLASAAIWLGGLAVLVALLLPRAHPRVLAKVLPAWSRWATVAVCWLVGGGTLMALIELGGWGALTSTDYGRLLLVKAGLLSVVLGVAFFSRRLVVRRGAAGRLRLLAGAEVGLIALVMVASSVLVQTTPGRSATVEADAVEDARGYSTTLTSDVFSVQFEIFPVQLGENNTLHAFVYTPEGKPMNVAEWKVTAALPEKDVEPFDNPIATIRGNQGIGAVTFPFPGKWELSLTIRVSDVDQATVRTTVPVS
ncbi:copper resistance protein CopC [Actinomycetes bacterium KLBMP 9797]